MTALAITYKSSKRADGIFIKRRLNFIPGTLSIPELEELGNQWTNNYDPLARNMNDLFTIRTISSPEPAPPMNKFHVEIAAETSSKSCPEACFFSDVNRLTVEDK
ncbi:hypothetical protein NPIL_398291 [Nephila pilipes]|uniref:Uncharacterized protein n=1 Tax=Nephila pilipes TaxID=299642 RepID=A0A8X6Q337_NEPPI|nr:hypothetical protein NPIL_398291 [Nephila pilipes]